MKELACNGFRGARFHQHSEQTIHLPSIYFSSNHLLHNHRRAKSRTKRVWRARMTKGTTIFQVLNHPLVYWLIFFLHCFEWSWTKCKTIKLIWHEPFSAVGPRSFIQLRICFSKANTKNWFAVSMRWWTLLRNQNPGRNNFYDMISFCRFRSAKFNSNFRPLSFNIWICFENKNFRRLNNVPTSIHKFASKTDTRNGFVFLFTFLIGLCCTAQNFVSFEVGIVALMFVECSWQRRSSW